MLLRRNLRRIAGLVLLAIFLGAAIFAVRSPFFVKKMLYDARWYLVALAAIALASNGYRVWMRWQRPAPPPPKTRPAHLKLVRNDETLH